MMPILAFLRGLRPMSIILGALVGLLVCIELWQGFSIAKLDTKLAECRLEKKALEAEVAINYAKVTELLAAVSDQNAEMRKLSNYTDFMREEANRAALELERAQAAHERELEELTATQGSTCVDGIALIDRELKL